MKIQKGNNTQQSTNQTGLETNLTLNLNCNICRVASSDVFETRCQSTKQIYASRKGINNQLAYNNGEECLNCELEREEECNKCNFKIRCKNSREIHFANQCNKHLRNKATTNPTTIAPLSAFDKLSPESMGPRNSRIA